MRKPSSVYDIDHSPSSKRVVWPPCRNSVFGVGKQKWIPIISKGFFSKVASDIVNHKVFVAFSMALTTWALSADDIRLRFTSKPADVVFDCLVGFCLFFFVIEIILSCKGIGDYYMGFFFGLDVVAVATLILDLTFVAEALFGGSEGDETDKARSSKTARAGARAGRVVRVLRLVRIVKFFKAIQESRPRKPVHKMPGDPRWDLGHDREAHHIGQESLVGKKLSKKTTQRTIILVLMMLIVLPLLSTDGYARTAPSAEYAANDVQNMFVQWRANNVSRREYEEMLLKYIYYHNWFTSNCVDEIAACSKWFYGQVWWIGIEGKSSSLPEIAEQAGLQLGAIRDWNQVAGTQQYLYRYGVLPEPVIQRLGRAWTSDCRASNTIFGVSLLGELIEDHVDNVIQCPNQLRLNEREKFTPRLMKKHAFNDFHFSFYFDLRPFTWEEATLNLLKTVFVCIVLCVASVCFSSDANALVLHPVERMITRVERIRDDPLSAMRIADEEFQQESAKQDEIDRKNAEKWRIAALAQKLCQPSREELMETVILEKTIIKLGSLLALGFGEAGTNIVKHNMEGAQSSKDCFVDAMIEGSRVDCVLGSVRIQDFSIATEVLQEHVMTFVNQVAEIVHGIVDQFFGAVNKNKGDSFMVVWRTDGAADDANRMTKYADFAIIAFAKVVGSVHSSHILAQYRRHPGLQQKMPGNCRVKVSCGLHAGWAIEGAVGTEFKIDASYVSPNVNLAISLELATEIYDVCFLVGHSVVQRASMDLASRLRLIDRVRISGSRESVELYSMDLDFSPLKVEKPSWNGPWTLKHRHATRLFLQSEKKIKWNSDENSAALFDQDDLIQNMRKTFFPKFVQIFNMGFQNYAEGEWNVAKDFLREAQRLRSAGDGPSRALLQFMDQNNFVAPASWRGIRDLNDLA